MRVKKCVDELKALAIKTINDCTVKKQPHTLVRKHNLTSYFRPEMKNTLAFG